MKQVLILNGDIEKNASTNFLINAYKQGAESAGATVRELAIIDLIFNSNKQFNNRQIAELEPDLQKALTASIGHLSDEDRLLVKLYYFDGLKLREAGAILGVHEATASRRLTRIHSDLRLRVEESLKEEHGWTRPETEQAFSDIALHLEADIEPMLGSETMIENEREMTG